MARSLHALGVRPGDRVAIVAPNCMEYVEALFGISLLGAVVVTINARYRAAELAYVVADSAASVLLTSDVMPEIDFVGQLCEALPGLATAADPAALELEATPGLRACVMLGQSSPAGFLDRAAFDDRHASVPESVIWDASEGVRVRDPAIMMYTSGTTAQPKGCPLTHEAIVRTGDALNTLFTLTEKDVWWDPLPMFHLSSILPMTAALRAGSRYVTMVDFEVDAAVRQIVDERVTYMFGTFPTLNQELLAHPGFRSADLSSVRLINQVAPPDMQRALQEALPQATQVSAYGCTELGGIISQNDPSETPEQRAVGLRQAVPGDRGSHRRSRDRARNCPPVRLARSLPAASGCSRGTTTIPCERPRRSTPTASSTRATSAASTRAGASPTTDGRRTCSRSVARTSPRSRSSRTSRCIRPCAWPRS